MRLTEIQKQNIVDEYNDWFSHQYGGKSVKERQELGQFFTPPQLTIRMIEKLETLENLEEGILDPTCGCGGLLAGCILSGADPTKIYGIELDPTILEICRERLGKLGVPKYNLHLGNALNEDCYDNFNEDYSYDPIKDQVSLKGKPKFSFGAL